MSKQEEVVEALELAKKDFEDLRGVYLGVIAMAERAERALVNVLGNDINDPVVMEVFKTASMAVEDSKKLRGWCESSVEVLSILIAIAKGGGDYGPDGG